VWPVDGSIFAMSVFWVRLRARAIKMGEFSPIQATLFVKITEKAQIMGLFFHGKSCVLIFAKN
jgi:putative effector of murein hydrolase LrgA (UPF0299 family)